jgi:hypothetical protein
VLLALVLVSLGFKYLHTNALSAQHGMPVFTALEKYAHFQWCFLLLMLLYVQIIGSLARINNSNVINSASSHPFFAAPLEFGSAAAAHTATVEIVVFVILATIWGGVHCYAAFTIYGGLKNFRRDRLKNAQEFGDGTHHIGGGSGKVHIQHTNTNSNSNSDDGSNSRGGGRSNSYRTNSQDGDLQEEATCDNRGGMSLQT